MKVNKSVIGESEIKIGDSIGMDYMRVKSSNGFS
jgi:hypothetical protein